MKEENGMQKFNKKRKLDRFLEAQSFPEKSIIKEGAFFKIILPDGFVKVWDYGYDYYKCGVLISNTRYNKISNTIEALQHFFNMRKNL